MKFSISNSTISFSSKAPLEWTICPDWPNMHRTNTFYLDLHSMTKKSSSSIKIVTITKDLNFNVNMFQSLTSEFQRKTASKPLWPG